MKTSKKYLLLVIVLTAVLSIKAQNYNFWHYSLEQGLSQSQIYSMTQAPTGEMWFGTLGGAISIFNGIETKYITTSEGLPDYKILELFTASDGKIWIGSGTSISYYDGYKINTLEQDFSNVRAITEDSKGKIWFSTDTAAYYIENEEIKLIDAEYSITPSIFCDSKDNIWFFSNNGIDRLSNGKLESILEEDILGEVIFEDSNNNLWFGTTKGLYQYNTIEFKLFTTKNGLPGNSITDIVEDKEGRIWISTENSGISFYSGGKFTNICYNEGLSIEYIADLYKDKHDNIWIGSDGDGAYLFKGFMFKQLSFDTLLANNFVMCVKFDSQENLWMGTDGGGIAVKTKDGYKTYTSAQNGLFSDYIYDIIEDSQGNMWFASMEGFAKFDGKKYKTFTKAKNKDVPVDFIMSLMEDNEGNIWVGTNGAGILKVYADNKIDWIDTRFDYELSTIWDIYQTENNDIYFATDNGLLKITEKDTVVYSTPEGLNEPGLSNIYEDEEGIIWLATDRGISRFDGESFKNYTREDGLSSDISYLAHFTKNGFLISGNEKGIDKIKFDENGEIISIKHYGKQDGFFGIECNMNAVVNDTKGNMYIGTIDGVTIYNPYYEEEKKKALVNISNIKLFYQDIDWLEYADSIIPWNELPCNTILPYNKNNLTFEFIGIDYQNSGKVQYRFMLEGFDEKWMPLTSATDATYTNIPPGEYTFKVKALTKDEAWSDEAEFYFEIKKPFWKTALFYIIIFIVLGALIHFIITLRLKRLKQAKIKLQNKVNERTAEILQQKEEIEAQRDEIETQKETAVRQRDEIVKQKKKVTDSIIYAKRIQNAIFPQNDIFKSNFDDYLIFFRPRDIVSGDFYWIKEVNQYVLFAVADSTGHGVPGAFMSLLGISFLNEIVVRSEITSTAQVLEVLRIRIKNALKQSEENESRDGMDIGICCLNKTTNELEFSGANIHLTHIKKNKPHEVEVYKADRQPIGIYVVERSFVQKNIKLEKGDQLYLYSDGIIDQLGGMERSKYMRHNFKKLLEDISDKSMSEQKDIIVNQFEEWKGNMQQLDDVLVVGIKI